MTPTWKKKKKKKKKEERMRGKYPLCRGFSQYILNPADKVVGNLEDYLYSYC